jgi:chorismate mutase
VKGFDPMTIEDWRIEIDAIDDQLLELLNRRARIAVIVGQSKEIEGMALRDRAREREVIERALNKNPGPLDEQALKNLFSCIIRESRRIQGGAMDDNLHHSPLSQWPYVQASPEHSDH